jgi:4-nitrophenyl phosphatase
MDKIKDIKGLIIDMDGVLWHGSEAINGIDVFFDVLRTLQLPFILATNNASLTQTQYVDKLMGMGIVVHQHEVLTSSMATAKYLDERLPSDKRRAFVIGEDGLRQPLLEYGFTLTDLYQVDQPDKNIVGEGPDLVVSGLDRALTWDKLATATLNIKAGADFYATNADTTLPTEKGEVMGNGGTLAALTACTGVHPTCIGKPEPILYQQALAILNTSIDETVAIGDRLDTDILGAVNAGIRSIMVLTGVSNKEDIANVDYEPTCVVDDILAVAELLKESLKSEERV